MTQVNKERMLAEFKEIVALPCHSLQERPVFELLKGKLEALGFTVEEDDAGEKLGGNCGNLWAFLPASALSFAGSKLMGNFKRPPSSTRTKTGNI